MRMCGVSASDREVIGCREVVGYGVNGKPDYVDRADYPFPAIRFLADNPYLQVITFNFTIHILRLELNEVVTLKPFLPFQ